MDLSESSRVKTVLLKHGFELRHGRIFHSERSHQVTVSVFSVHLHDALSLSIHSGTPQECVYREFIHIRRILLV